MNIFEGARRIVRLLSWIWVVFAILTGLYIYYHNPAVRFSFGFLIVLTGPIFLYVFSYTIGNIVRGFMGIPKGKDGRVNELF